MILDTTTKTIEVVLLEAKTTTDCDVTANWGDYATAGFLPGGSETVSNGVAAVTVVAAPASGVQRLVNEITVHNNDTVSHTVILRLNDNSTIRIFREALVSPGADFSYSPSALPNPTNVPTPTVGTALDFIRINAGGTAYEVQSPAATLGDIAGGTSGAINSTPVGAGTPSTGAFTTLSATSTVSGAGFTAWAASPPAIGGTAAAAGAFTTLSASSTITPSQTSGIVGTTTNNSANAGSVGEFISSQVTQASPINVANAVVANVTSISLTAGDWDVSANAGWLPAATTTVASLSAGISQVSATTPAFPNNGGGWAGAPSGGWLTGAVQLIAIGTMRLSLSGTTTIYLVVNQGFGVSTCQAFGYIGARRVR